MRWEGEGEARGYEAVEGCVVGSVGEMIDIFNLSRQVKRTYLVAVLISPDSEKGSLVASFSSTSSRATGSCFSSISAFLERTSTPLPGIIKNYSALDSKYFRTLRSQTTRPSRFKPARRVESKVQANARPLN